MSKFSDLSQATAATLEEIRAAFKPRGFRSKASPRVPVYADIGGASMTKQSFKDECDINVLMKRYQQSGVLPPVDGRERRYIDGSSVDYHEAMLMVADARSAFMELSSSLRERFQNDPGRLLEFLEDSRNREEAVALGLVNPPQADAKPVQVRVIADAPAGADESVAAAAPSAKRS